MYYVYILKSSKDGKLYTGHTVNLKQRLHRHNMGGVRSTKNRRPLKLIFYEVYLKKDDAKRREKYFKTTDGKKALKIMLRKTLLIINNA